MLEFSAWAKQGELTAKPWLIVGQGPTMAAHRQVDLATFHVWGLDHVVRELPVDVAHALDVETVAACGDAVEQHCRWLVMPRRPLVNQKPGPSVESYFDRTPVLRRLAMQQRLVTYHPTATPPGRTFPPVHGHRGTVVAAGELIVQLGVRQVRSLGLDGGHACAPFFHDCELRELSRPGYEHRDVSPREVDVTVEAHGVDHEPLLEPMRVFLAVTESLRVPARVLEHQIRQHANRPVVVDYLLGVKPPRPHKMQHFWRSTAPLRRFAIPEWCGYRGRALYLEPTALVFSDLHALWDIPFGPQKVLCTFQAARPINRDVIPDRGKHGSQSSVTEIDEEPWMRAGRQTNLLLLDCSRLHWDVPRIVRGLDDGSYDRRQLLTEMCIIDPDEIADTLPPEWNCCEWFEPGQSKLVHFASAVAYPWKNNDNPLAEVWDTAFQEAVAAGVIPAQEVVLGVAAGHLKRDLLAAFEGTDAERIAAQRLNLPHRVRLVAGHQAQRAVRGARRLASDAVRRLRASG